MNLEDIANRVPGWLTAEKGNADIAISSRTRIARNIKGYFYAHRAEIDRLAEIANKVLDASMDAGFRKEDFLDNEKLDDNLRNLLLERNLATKTLISKPGRRGVIIKDNEFDSIMINEEDHLRIQSIRPGLNIEGTLESALEIVQKLSSKIKFSFSQKYGYLTACPTNFGTGMRTSVLLHLPGLVMTKEIQKVFRSASYLGLALRGFHGEGSDAVGNLFQISNQNCLGRDEKSITENLAKDINKIIDYEKKASDMLMENAKYQTEDKVYRSLGILKTARMLSSREFLDYSSDLRLGLRLGILNNLEISDLNRLMVQTQPEHLQIFMNKRMDLYERDVNRAKMVRERFIDLSI